MKVTVKHVDNLKFTCLAEGKPEICIENASDTPCGPTPKELILMGLAGCTGMDVASILKKMRQEFKQFYIAVETTVTDEHPKVFNDIKILYKISNTVSKEKMERAVELSQTQYCGVSTMIKAHSNISYEIEYLSE